MHMMILPIVLPLAAAIACLALPRSTIQAQRLVSLLVALIMIPIAAYLLHRASHGGVDVYSLGGWRAPFGIALVLDRLGALMMLLCAVLALPVLLYAADRDDAAGSHFHPLFQLQLAGINGAFLTGDLFNLFVFFEVLLLASYCLLMHGNGLARSRAGIAYVVLNLVGSALFLVGLALLYGTLGTLNLADVAQLLPGMDTADQGLVRAAAALLLSVFALKAALLPLSFWLPHVYSAATAPAAALFAIMTKVGVYAILRVAETGFSAAPLTSDLLQPWLTPLAIATIIAGTIGALAAQRLAGIVANLVLVSTGTLLCAVAVDAREAIAAGLYYLVHTTLVSAAFFLLAGHIAVLRGKAGDLLGPGPAPSNAVVLGGAYLLLSVTICGAPPFSGFIGKIMIMQALMFTPMAAAVWVALLLSSLLPALVLARAASTLFWEPGDAGPTEEKSQVGLSGVAVGLLLLASITVAVLAAPIAKYAQATAQQLGSPQLYIQSVLGYDRHIERKDRP
ncbi:monovalent cation/H+ antiporter subunit D [Bradyrhizobium sp. USDA 10063]